MDKQRNQTGSLAQNVQRERERERERELQSQSQEHPCQARRLSRLKRNQSEAHTVLARERVADMYQQNGDLESLNSNNKSNNTNVRFDSAGKILAERGEMCDLKKLTMRFIASA
jgi:hypothetical protein